MTVQEDGSIRNGATIGPVSDDWNNGARGWRGCRLSRRARTAHVRWAVPLRERVATSCAQREITL